MPAFDRERAAGMLLDALVMGDKLAAEKWNATERTIRNHRARVESDPAFAAFFHERRRRVEAEWRPVRLAFLRKGIKKLEELVDKAEDPKFIPAVAEAVKIVGELQVASDALNVDPVDPLTGEQPATDAGGAAQGPAPSVH